MPDELSFAEEIARLLEISTDSAYRRIRGEKVMNFDEMRRLCQHFSISADQILQTGHDSVCCQTGNLTINGFHLKRYLNDLQQFLHRVARMEGAVLYMQEKSIPVFYYMLFPDLCQFRFYAWEQTQSAADSQVNRSFRLDRPDQEIQDMVRDIRETFLRIPSIELMSPDTIQPDLRLIQYLMETGNLTDPESLERIFRSMSELIDFLETMATTGRKKDPADHGAGEGAAFTLYVNDFLVGDDTVVAVGKRSRICVMYHAAVQLLTTTDEPFCDYAFQFMDQIIQKSTLISRAGEKSRSRFFNLFREKLNNCMQRRRVTDQF